MDIGNRVLMLPEIEQSILLELIQHLGRIVFLDQSHLIPVMKHNSLARVVDGSDPVRIEHASPHDFGSAPLLALKIPLFLLYLG